MHIHKTKEKPRSLGDYVKTQSLFSLENEIVDAKRRILNGAENTKKNEWYSIQQTALNNMIKLSSLYGFDPSSRAKIAHLQPTSKEEVEDPLVALAKKMNGEK